MKKILYFSLVTWKWIKQRPHFVPYYISKEGYDVTYLSKHPFASKLKNKNLFVKNESEFDNLNIKDINILPLERKIGLIKSINKYNLQKEFNKDYDLLILTHPEQYEFIENSNKKIIYECMDNIPEFFDDMDTKNKLIELESKLATRADKIVVSSNVLKEKFIENYNIEAEKIIVIYNGFDKESFEKVSDCEKTVELKPKSVVYIGTISEWLNLDYIYKFAKENKDYNMYIIGPIETQVMSKIKDDIDNVKFLGPIEHKDIHKYIVSGDVMLIPFIINKLIESVDPVKAYEYLYYRKPVVSSYWNEMDKFGNYMYFYKDYKTFERSIKTAYQNKIKSTEGLDEFLSESNWKSRLKPYISLLTEII